MSNPRCNCGAREGTAHATNCTAYLDNIYKRIAELEQENARLREALQEIASDDYEDLSHHTMVMIAKDALQESSDG